MRYCDMRFLRRSLKHILKFTDFILLICKHTKCLNNIISLIHEKMHFLFSCLGLIGALEWLYLNLSVKVFPGFRKQTLLMDTIDYAFLRFHWAVCYQSGKLLAILLNLSNFSFYKMRQEKCGLEVTKIWCWVFDFLHSDIVFGLLCCFYTCIQAELHKKLCYFDFITRFLFCLTYNNRDTINTFFDWNSNSLWQFWLQDYKFCTFIVKTFIII